MGGRSEPSRATSWTAVARSKGLTFTLRYTRTHKVEETAGTADISICSGSPSTVPGGRDLRQPLPQATVELTDDIDGSPAAESVNFALYGQRFAIDLSAEHAARLRDALAEFVAGGRRTSGPSRRTGAGRRRQGRPSNVAAADVRACSSERHIDLQPRSGSRRRGGTVQERAGSPAGRPGARAR